MTVDGEAEVTGSFDLDDILKPHDMEERVYRLRCVEAWSMVVPWNGIPLGDVLKRFKPTSEGQVRRLRDGLRPAEMPGQRRGVLDFPYVEGLTMAEAMHPLTMLAVGVYGVELAQSERRAAAAGGALEVRLQEHQVDRSHQFHREAAADHLVAVGAR